MGENKKYILLIFLDQAQSETENKTNVRRDSTFVISFWFWPINQEHLDP